MNRYAIVRVDKTYCPDKFENIQRSSVCNYYEKYTCDKCKYGDTKEQLVAKVAQAIKRELKGDCVAGLKDTVFVMKWCVAERLAKEIVEFLGVE